MPLNTTSGAPQRKKQESLSAMLLVSRFLSLPSSSAPISRRTSSKMILGDHSLTNCTTSFALMARGSKRSLEREANFHHAAMDACGELTVPMRGGSCELCGHWQGVDDDASDC